MIDTNEGNRRMKDGRYLITAMIASLAIWALIIYLAYRLF
jgi:hypothetical protein